MPLSTGARLGPYEVLSPIGAGGMGEVYRAKDTRLDRTVAIKIIRSHAAVGAGFRERFSREAKAISALDHPNICALYDVGHESGVDYLVIQYLEGETLAERLTQGPLRPEQTLRYAAQMAAALDAAHRKNIVHRDLKPANVMLTKSGVKLLDFGLAKMVAQPLADGVADRATETSPLTTDGAILGTLPYMSPEQLEGRQLDGRSDVFSFGAILFEMLSGQRLFQSDSSAGVISAIMSTDRPLLGNLNTGLPDNIQPSLDRLLRKCLAKQPDDRWQSAGDLADELSWIEAESRRTGQVSHVSVRSSRWSTWSVTLAGLVGVSVAVGGLAWFGMLRGREPSAPPPKLQFLLDAPPQTTFGDLYDGIATSPDGRHVVLAARSSETRSSLWLRTLDSLNARPLQGTEDAHSPTWSPDGRSVAFFADDKLKRLDIAGGTPLSLCDATVAPFWTTGAAWSPNGVILFGGTEGLQQVSASGGVPTLVTRVDPSRRETGHGFPQFLPDANRFLYLVTSNDANVQGIYVSSLGNPGQRTRILGTPGKAAYAPPREARPGHLLWMQDHTLVAQRFDAGALQLHGDPVPVAQDVDVNIYNARPAFWVSDAGLLTYFTGSTFSKRSVVWMNRNGKEPVRAAPDDVYWNLALAPGAERMAAARWETGGPTGQANMDLWIWEFARGVQTRLTFDPARDGMPVWSPDGKQLAFASSRDGGVAQIYRRQISGEDEPLTEGPHYKTAADWTRDGRYILYTVHYQERGDVMALPLEGDKKPIAIARTPSDERWGVMSPNGKWVAFTADYTGRLEVYVQAFTGDGSTQRSRSPISGNGGLGPKWRGDGRELFFLNLDGDLMAAAIQEGPHGLRAETPSKLFSPAVRMRLDNRQFDVTPDGQRFLMILLPADERERQQLTVVSNWVSSLGK